jgi:antitoxin VapB
MNRGTSKTGSPNERTTAKLFTNGRSQAVRLPKEFRFEGDAVSIRRVKEGVLLEPIKPWPTTEELRARFALMDSLGADDLFPNGRNQGVLEPENLFD